mgnify:CR=1 FL=1
MGRILAIDYGAKRTGLAVTVSCGEMPREDYAHLRACGADRYLLKHETADPVLYDSLHPCGTLSERVACLKTLKALGFETGSGFMIGLPGQTNETVARDLLLLREIGCDCAQGYYLARPMPVRAFEALIKGGDSRNERSPAGFAAPAPVDFNNGKDASK